MSDREQKQHLILQQVQELAIELGRTPTRVEFKQRYGCKFENAFGTWGVLVQAAGLDPNLPGKARKINNSIFNRSIVDHLEQYEPREVIKRGPYPRIAVISDIHWPFENQRVIDAFYRYIEKHKPAYVLLNGDGWDRYAHGRFPRSHNVYMPIEEDQLSRRKNEVFWEEVKKAVDPNTELVQMLGNHDIRPLKQILSTYPEAEEWVKEGLKKGFTFDGVNTIMDPRQEFMIGDIMVHHGYRGKLGDHRDYTLYNAIIGHTHSGGVVFRRIRGQTIWELNSGLAGDPEAKGLTYTPQRITHWTPGFGFVDEDGPRFVPVG